MPPGTARSWLPGAARSWLPGASRSWFPGASRSWLLRVLHRLAFARIGAPELHALLVGRLAATDHLGKQIFDHRVDLARLQGFGGGRRHVVAEVLAREAEAALVGVGE